MTGDYAQANVRYTGTLVTNAPTPAVREALIVPGKRPEAAVRWIGQNWLIMDGKVAFASASRFCLRVRRAVLGCLLIQPGVLETPAVEDAVDHRRDVLDARIAARTEPVVVDHRPRCVLLQPTVDFPDQLPPLLLI